jgi:hypothetical protein
MQPLSALEQWHGGCPLAASVAADLERLGYASWAQRVVGSAGFGAPLSARRAFVVAAHYGDARDVLLAEVRGPVRHCMAAYLPLQAARQRPACLARFSVGRAAKGTRRKRPLARAHARTTLCQGRFVCRGSCIDATGGDCWECFR